MNNGDLANRAKLLLHRYQDHRLGITRDVSICLNPRYLGEVYLSSLTALQLLRYRDQTSHNWDGYQGVPSAKVLVERDPDSLETWKKGVHALLERDMNEILSALTNLPTTRRKQRWGIHIVLDAHDSGCQIIEEIWSRRINLLNVRDINTLVRIVQDAAEVSSTSTPNPDLSNIIVEEAVVPHDPMEQRKETNPNKEFVNSSSNVLDAVLILMSKAQHCVSKGGYTHDQT